MSARLWVMIAFIFALALTAGWHRAGVAEEDAAAATRLLEKGREAYKSKDYELASIHLDDAYAVSSDCLDALYMSAQAYEKAGKKHSAFLSYRAFLKACEARAKASKLPAALASCQRKAGGRVKSLGKTTLALEVVRARHVEKLVTFAKENAKAVPDVSVRALERARDIAVDTQAIDELLGLLRPRVDAAPDRVASPFEEDVVAWKNLIVDETFGHNDGWAYSYGTLEVDVREGKVVHARGELLDSGPRYVYEVEARVNKVEGEMWVIGLIFGHNDDIRYSAFIQPQGVEICRVKDRGQRGIQSVARPLSAVNVWHRLTVRVDEASVEIWLDGQKVLVTDEGKLGGPAAGDYGVTFQDGIIEVRELRIGALR